MSEYWPVFIIILQLIFLEGILSIDNAAVIGALVSPLPDDEHVVWPRSLKGIGDWLHPLLGNQRMAALRVGLLGAYAGRGLMLFLTSFLIHNSFKAYYALRYKDLREPWGIPKAQMAVAPEYQHKGVGHLLLKAVEERARQNGFCSLATMARHRDDVFREVWVSHRRYTGTSPGDNTFGRDGERIGLTAICDLIS